MVAERIRPALEDEERPALSGQGPVLLLRKRMELGPLGKGHLA